MLEQLPSDRLSEYFKSTASKDKIYNIGKANLTPIYNYYVDTIGGKINYLHEQGNSLLFKFLVEYFIISNDIVIYSLYQEGYNSMAGIGGYDIDMIISFIDNSNMPSQLDIKRLSKFLYKLDREGILTNMSNMLNKEFNKHGIKWTTLESYDYDKDGFILPLSWTEISKDVSTFINNDIDRYRSIYKYNRAIFLDVVTLDVFDIDRIGAGTLEETVLQSVVPIDTEIYQSYIEDE